MSLRAQKFISASIILSVIFPLIFFLSYVNPQPAEAADASCATQIAAIIAGMTTKSVASAITGVPISDISAELAVISSAGSNYGQFFSTCILKPLIIAMAQRVLANITQSLVTWIQSGFHGNPGFVTNINDLISNSSNQAIGQFINGTFLGKYLCQPFATQIRIALATEYSQQPYAGCTLTQIDQNIQNIGNTKQAWSSWLNISTVPANNQYGEYVQASGILNNLLGNQITNLNNQISRNGGFLDYQVCDGIDEKEWEATAPDLTQNPPDPSTLKPDDTLCGHTKTTTPGATTEAALSAKFGAEYGQIGLAQDINQIIGALVTEMVNKTLTGAGGLLGGGGSSGGSTPPPTPITDTTDLSALASSESASNASTIATLNQQISGAANESNSSEAGNTNYALTATVSASSVADGSDVQNAVDGDVSTIFTSGNELTPSYTLNLGSSESFSQINIAAPYPTDQTLGSIEVEISNSSTFDPSDPSTKIWDPQTNTFVPPGSETASNETAFNSTTSPTFSITASGNAQYVQIIKQADIGKDRNGQCDSGTSDSSHNCLDPLQISEIQVVSIPVTSPSATNSGVPASQSVSFIETPSTKPTILSVGNTTNYSVNVTVSGSPTLPLQAMISLTDSAGLPLSSVFNTNGYSLTRSTANGQISNIDTGGTLISGGTVSASNLPNPVTFGLSLKPESTSKVGYNFEVQILDGNGNILGTDVMPFIIQ